ncbi:MAG: zinc ribbon domain-containing protein [Selenomonadaceae bacterium]|nr:zinc ribbon domain-containing protein [Selenomonadaceae bacterium]
MANKNIFEMLNLEFDPPDNLKKIRAAYENWKKRLTAELNTTVDPTRLGVIKSELAMDNYIVQIIENARLRQREAEALKQIRVEQLRLYIDLQRGNTSGTLQVNQSQIKHIRDKLKLSAATIEATYREQGFIVKPERSTKSIADKLNGFFIADSVMEELRKSFADFQTVPDEKNYPWSANVSNLYELAYYLEHQIEPSADFYKRRDTDDLREIFRDEAKKVSAPIPAWQSIKALLNLAQTQIFNSDDNRFKYDHSLRIERLSDFFAKLKSAPEIFKRDKYFADNCINRIRRTFPNLLNYELSAALYNKVAGLLNDPYESISDDNENFFCMTCSNCGAFENFRTREEAERASCKVCGETFYAECPKCGKKVPANADHCPACDFSLSELRRFNYYVDHANVMLDLLDRSAKSFEGSLEVVMAEIIDNLSKAKVAKPESPELTKIEWRIHKISAENKKRELIKWAEAKLPGLNTHPDTAVSACMEILRRIKDYRPARDRLRLIKPKKPLSAEAVIHKSSKSSALQNTGTATVLGRISVNAKSSSTSLVAPSYNLTCTVNWQPDNDLGVVYTVVRKIDGIPQNYRDGVVIVEGTDKIEADDNDIKPGVFYGYAVFATRLGAISEPATCTAVFYSDIDENRLLAKTEDGHCSFTWNLPSDNCLGVRIIRSDKDGNTVVVADCTQSPFVDRLVKNRKQYQYCLQCVYYSAAEVVLNRAKFLAEASSENFNRVWKIDQAFRYSKGLTITMTPELPPRQIKNLEYKVVDNRVRFSWQSTGDFELLFKEIPADKKISAETGKIFDAAKLEEILGEGKILNRAESSDQFCEFELTGDIIKIAAVSATTHSALVDEIITIANVEDCEIDAEKTQIVGRDLKLVLKNLPKNIYMIHYRISTDEDDEIYATVEDARERHMNRIYASKYERDSFIMQPHLPQRELFVTVIGEYKLKDGTTIYSEPSTLAVNNRPREEISYRFEWGKSGLFNKKNLAKNCKLIVESKAESTPKLFIAYRKDRRVNVELKDEETRVLQTIPEYKHGFPNGRLEILLPDEIWEGVDPGTVIKLLPAEEDEKFFDLKESDLDSLTVPKK